MALQHPEAAKVVMFVSSDKEEPSHQKWLPGRINAAALKAQVGLMPWRTSQVSQLDLFKGAPWLLVKEPACCMATTSFEDTKPYSQCEGKQMLCPSFLDQVWPLPFVNTEPNGKCGG